MTDTGDLFSEYIYLSYEVIVPVFLIYSFVDQSNKELSHHHGIDQIPRSPGTLSYKLLDSYIAM